MFDSLATKETKMGPQRCDELHFKTWKYKMLQRNLYTFVWGKYSTLPLSFSLWSGWHFCLGDFNKLLHTKLNKVRVRCCWGNFANYNYSIPGPKGKFALHSKRDSGNGTGFISGSNSGYGLVSGRIKRFTSFRPRRKVRSKEAGKMAAPVKQREREKREVGQGKLTGRSTGQTSITA